MMHEPGDTRKAPISPLLEKQEPSALETQGSYRRAPSPSRLQSPQQAARIIYTNSRALSNT